MVESLTLEPSVATRMPTSSEEPAVDWCEPLRQSDQGAFEHMFRTLHGPLVQYALMFSKSRPIALDIVQDAFLKLWEVRETLDPNRSVKALLYRMVRNLSLNEQRDRQSRQLKLLDVKRSRATDFHTLQAGVDAAVLKTKLQAWINALPERQREALLLSRFEGLTHDEVAHIMEVSPRTVNNHIVKALKQLRSQIRAFEPAILEER